MHQSALQVGLSFRVSAFIPSQRREHMPLFHIYSYLYALALSLSRAFLSSSGSTTCLSSVVQASFLLLTVMVLPQGRCDYARTLLVALSKSTRREGSMNWIEFSPTERYLHLCFSINAPDTVTPWVSNLICSPSTVMTFIGDVLLSGSYPIIKTFFNTLS